MSKTKPGAKLSLWSFSTIPRRGTVRWRTYDGRRHGYASDITAPGIAANQQSRTPSFNYDFSMSASRSANGNRLLSVLPAKQWQSLQKGGALQQVALALGEVVHEPASHIDYVYFPEDCVISLMAAEDGRMSIEVGLVGGEGMAGIAVAMGSTVSPVRALVQRDGSALRMTAAAFHTLYEGSPPLKLAVSHYAHGLMVQATQAAFCSHFHLLESRLARSLLTMRDRVHSNALHLTHEFLAHALGVRRVGITKAATSLQQRGLISYSRGDIRILDDAGLEHAACTCYKVVKTLAGA